MATIHPSSTVDPSARLADDVYIGPGCVIEGDVEIGAETHLVGRVYLVGPMKIGARNRLYPAVCLGFEPQSRRVNADSPTAGVIIGDDNLIREGVTIHRATSAEHATRVGNRNFLMANSHLGHDVIMGNDCTIANGALIAGHVEIGDGVILGGNSAVHQFCRVGRYAMLSGTCGITQDLPPFCTAYVTRRFSSLNIVGLRRNGLQAHVDNLKQVFDIFFRRGHTLTNAIRITEEKFPLDPLCMEFTTFVKGTTRGITPYASSEEFDQDRN